MILFKLFNWFINAFWIGLYFRKIKIVPGNYFACHYHIKQKIIHFKNVIAIDSSNIKNSLQTLTIFNSVKYLLNYLF